MKYVLIGTRNGKTYSFFIEAVAKTFQQAYGGCLMQTSVVETETLEVV